jgi:hypothetical protein
MVERIENHGESEAPAELFTPRFGKSLTLPSNELVGQGLTKHVYRGGLTLPVMGAIPRRST